MKVLKAFLLGLATLLLLLVIAAGLLTATTGGLRTAVGLAQQFAPGELDVQAIDGRLLDRFRFGELRYRAGELDVHLVNFEFAWRPAALIEANLDIDRLAADSIAITLPPTETDADTGGAIELPLTVRLRQLDVARLQIDSQILHDIQLRAHSVNDTLFIEHFSLQGEIDDIAVKLNASGQAAINPPWSHTLQAEFELQLPDQPVIAGRIDSQGDAAEVIAGLTLTEPEQVEASLTARNLLDAPSWQATLATRDADLSPWLDSATSLTARLEADGSAERINARLDGELQGAINETLNLDTALRLDPDEPSITLDKLQVDNPTRDLALTLAGDVHYGDQPAVDVSGDWSLAQPQPASGRLSVSGGLDDYRLQLSADSPQPIASSWQLDAHGDGQSLTIDKLHGQLAQGRLQATGDVNWQEVPTFRLDGDWQDIVIPGSDEKAALRSPQGTFNLQGDLENYRLTSSGRLAGAQVPATDWQLRASGDQSHIDIEALTLGLLDGRVNVQGRAGWADGTLDASADVRLDAIDPGRHWPDWSGRLNGGSRVHFQQPAGGDWQAELEDLQIDGQLRGYPLTASGAAVIEADRYHIKALQLQVADSTLRADGRLGRDSEVDFELNSPDLAQLLPDAGGELRAQGEVSGDYLAPAVTATIRARQVQTPWLSVVELDAEADVNTGSNRFALSLNARELQRDDQLIEQLTLTSDGQLREHTLALDVQMPERQLTIAGSGGWNEQRWALALDEGTYNDTIAGRWQLDPPLRLNVSREHVDLPEHCWRQQPAALCLAGNWQAGADWSGQLDLNNYRIDTASDNVELEKVPPVKADLAVSLQVSGNADQLHDARGHIHLDDIRVTTDAETEMHISQLHTELEGNGDDGLTLTLDGRFDKPAPGKLSGRLQTGALRFDRIDETTLSGDLNANVDNLKPLLALYPRFVAKQAGLQADFTVSGNIGSPALDGNLSLRASDFGVPELGITLSTLELDVRGQPEQGLSLEGRAQSGPGQLDINGQVAMQAGAIVVPGLTIQGEEFRLLNLPDITALASPDLQIEFRDNLLKVRGQVLIPEALIQPFGAPGSIPVSSDEVIVSDADGVPDAGIDIDARVRVELGERIRIEGKGFESRLTGALDVNQTPGKPATASGELRLVDGAYAAYGQDLTIQTGEIIFTNQPIDNPALNIRAVRKVDNVTAGIAVSGTAQQPQTQLFSTPSMPEADILSYIVTGRPLSGAGSGDGNALLNAAANLGLKRTESLQQTIADTFGIDTLSVDTGTTSSGEVDAKLTVGKYLAPNLYISYGAGLVDAAANTVKLRYEINRHLSLEAEQGTGTGVDLLYQIESGSPWD
ncbi:translocation and assembly module TamB [Methylohalomonas lacus]|uniref:Translocation and assembly module TamB n=1 Tax=Methylohalomonas lacus TaxID=398773 RepID=A0AAE3HN48_9GAMM|nr:translocation/assembly module TamB domain-containing protein [Methylohalomonas lacus]MCS3903602.1 translocation and assembly module TamB [Methylohalomonas lacus]